MNTHSKLIAALALAFGLSACVVVPRHRGPDYVIAPPLPPVVEIDLVPYYHSGYYYHYHHDDRRWTYSRSKAGPWHQLPPERYPREIRYRDRDRDYDRDRDRHGERDRYDRR